MDRHTSLVHFNTHVGFTQAHIGVLNLELGGTDQSYMYMVEGMCMCVCVWELEISCYKVHSCTKMGE